MNYLAHILLSGPDPLKQLGNFIGDGVKGRTYENYPSRIREGILLHRAIDEYTDHHPLIKEITALMKEHFGRYSGIVADMYFDYFLASDFPCYAEVSLQKFAWRFYGTAIVHYWYLPLRFRNFLWHFIVTNRLCKYSTTAGLRRSLEIMQRYKNFPVDSRAAILFLAEHRAQLQEGFERFFPDLQKFCGVV